MTAYLITTLCLFSLAGTCNAIDLGRGAAKKPSTEVFCLLVNLGLAIWSAFLLAS